MRWLPGERKCHGDFHPESGTKPTVRYHQGKLRGGPSLGAPGHRGSHESSNSLGVSRCGWQPILFTEDFDLGFGLLLCLVDILADLRNIIARRFDVDDEALPIGCPNNPPTRQSWISEGEQKNGYQ